MIMGFEIEKGAAPEQSLGEYLRNLRLARKLSLREVEDASGVSNAYLSQLEQGKIAKPSPHFLHKLAGCYVVPYETLMEKAGYITREEPEAKSVSKQRRGQLAPSSLGELTRAEEEELLKHLAYIRWQQKK
jgi:transcriptional regulator with XRE-family HTH domain